MSKSQKPKQNSTGHVWLDVNGWTIQLRRSRRSKHLRLTVDQITGTVRVSGPLKTTQAQARQFVRDNADWVRKHTQKIPDQATLEPGQQVTIGGHRVLLQRTGKVRGLIHFDELAHVLWVPGPPEFFARRVKDFLKAHARTVCLDALHRHDAHLRAVYPSARPLGALTLRDTRSRWGSCSARGDISLNWRLILAPTFVLDYVTAHEIAHLAEHNHSPAFWSVCQTLCPDAPTAKAWLKQNGADLHRIV